MPVRRLCRARSLVALLLLLPAFAAPAAETLRVMSFNLWVGGESGGQPLAQSAAVIRAARADLVGLQETHAAERDGRRPDRGAKLATLLGWHYLNQGGSPGVLSRRPIVTNTPGRHGVVVRLPSGRTAHLFNIHFAPAPYQPYQLLGITYGDGRFIKTAAEAVAEARAARGRQVEALLAELRPALAAGGPVFLTGDFNEPSHQDWTPRAAAAGKAPLAVAWPATLAVTAAGLRDAFRAAHPDEVARPGWTWTPTTRPDDPKDRHDRIDFVFAGGPGVTVKSAEVVGESAAHADLVVTPYPSDHRAVVAEVEVR
jgi:endonuclease/exonuclease/phosphatase family metal-dependent hydrolase